MYSLSVPKENNPDKRQTTEEEIRRLMDAYGNDVLRTSYMYLKDMHKAEDAFQEVFIRVFNKYGSFRGESSEKTWIIKITMNVCKDMLRGSWLRRVVLKDDVSSGRGGHDIESSIVKRDEDRQLFREVISLQSPFKEVVILFYYHDYSTSEISKVLEIAEGTVRSRLHRAREILRSKLEGRFDIGGRY